MCDVDEAGEVAGCLVTNGPDDHAALPGNHFAVRDGLHHQPQPWHNGKMPKAKNKGKTPADQKKTSKVRRGIGQPLPRPKACKDWPKEPLQCAHEEDQLRQRGSKDSYWWTCLQCGSRWQRLEWEPDHEISAGAASSGDFRGSTAAEVIQTASKVPYPSRLPPPRSRPDLTTLVVEEKANAAAQGPVDPTVPHQGRMTPAVLPMPLENPLNRPRQVPMLPMPGRLATQW